MNVIKVEVVSVTSQCMCIKTTNDVHLYPVPILQKYLKMKISPNSELPLFRFRKNP